jgi:hypothetical protein
MDLSAFVWLLRSPLPAPAALANQNRFQRIEARCMRIGIVVDRVSEMACEGAGLVIGKVENHDRLDMAAVLADANTGTAARLYE